MGFSDYRKNQWLSDLGPIWLSLHYDNPDVAGAYASELFNGSYVRVSCDFTDPSAGAMFNVTAPKWSGLDATEITHIGGWDAKVNGNLEFSAPLPNKVRILAGQNYILMSGVIALSIGGTIIT